MIPRAVLGPPGLADEWAAAQVPGPQSRSFLLPPRLLSDKAWPSALLLFPAVGAQTGSLVGAHSARPLRHLKLQLSFVHTDRVRAQSPTPWGKRWLSHSWGLEQRGQAGQLRDGAQKRGRGQRKGPPQVLPREVEEKWAIFSSSPFSFLLKTASESVKEDLKPFTGCPQVAF